jgi:murein DD-endopeptidase MepM/ murein hydrolase activator NlpD
MAESFVERLWTWLHATFPERQVYVGSKGQLQFFTFSPTLQATLAGLGLIFLMWVAFASVNVIFKDRIIASKDHRYQQMQYGYENRIATLQTSYDDLYGAVVVAQDRFTKVANQLQTKQNLVSHLLLQGGIPGASGTGGSPAVAPASAEVPELTIAKGADTGMAGDSVGDDAAPRPATPVNTTNTTTQLDILPQAIEPQPRTGRPTKASMLDDAVERFAALGRFASALMRRAPDRTARDPLPNPPALHMIAYQADRIARMDGAETTLLEGVDRQVSSRIAQVQSTLRQVGVDSNALERRQSDVGGPFIPAQAMRIEGISDQAFTDAYAGASAHAKELSTLLTALTHVPLTTPVHGAQFEETSGFGARIDPFNRRIAFHPGIDFAGPWGSTVAATAPGTVTYAGPKVGYGNIVEIDHGYGFRTRYGHLSAVLVHPGTKVAKGSPVGKLGSTGRSTGPHVHYEVWLADVVRDPSRYIEAGRHVLQ